MRKSAPPQYIGSKIQNDPEGKRLKRYDRARVEGGFAARSEFFLAACDALADKILGPDPANADDAQVSSAA